MTFGSRHASLQGSASIPGSVEGHEGLVIKLCKISLWPVQKASCVPEVELLSLSP